MSSSSTYTPTELALARGLNKYSSNLWSFITEACYTKDQVDLSNPVKRFPDWGFVKALTELWLEEDILIVWKPRRMLVTWTLITCNLWLAMFYPYVEVALGARKEDWSDDLVDRALHVYRHIPKSVLPALPAAEKTYCHLAFPKIESHIRGIPQGADQLRQFTLTSILFDEFAFWEKAKESWEATAPTILGGGRLSAVSTTAGGFFERLVKGQLQSEEQIWNVTETDYQDKDFLGLKRSQDSRS